MKFNRCLIMFFLAFSLDGIANETEIVTKINQVLPAGMSVKGIKQSQVDGLFVVDIGDLQPIYASKDGNFFLYGEMYAIKNGELLNTTKQEISLNRRAILVAIVFGVISEKIKMIRVKITEPSKTFPSK